MPELPEVETVRLGLATRVVGSTITEIEPLHPRVTNPASILALTQAAEAQIARVNRRGKFLWLTLERDQGPQYLIAHLGKIGRAHV